MKNKALFLDRDGVINEEKSYVHKIEDFVFIDGVFDSLRKFQRENYLIIIITNQAGIAKGYYQEKDYRLLSDWMLVEFEKENISIDDVFYCPYHPDGIGEYRKESFDRKPNPGMILKATRKHKIDLSKSILVGDKESDIEAGLNAGIQNNYLVRTGHLVPKNTKAKEIFSNLNEIVLSVFKEK
jgi:D-glycero-D-manno-heptose 1,7-bisphosphate phosphatase